MSMRTVLRKIHHKVERNSKLIKNHLNPLPHLKLNLSKRRKDRLAKKILLIKVRNNRNKRKKHWISAKSQRFP